MRTIIALLVLFSALLVKAEKVTFDESTPDSVIPYFGADEIEAARLDYLALLSKVEKVTFDEATATPLQRQLVKKAAEVTLAFSDYPLEQSSAIKIMGPVLAVESPYMCYAPQYIGREYYEVVFIDSIPEFYLAVVQLLDDLTPMSVIYSPHNCGYGFERTPFEKAKNDTVKFHKFQYLPPLITEEQLERIREVNKVAANPNPAFYWW